VGLKWATRCRAGKHLYSNGLRAHTFAWSPRTANFTLTASERRRTIREFPGETS